MHCDTASCNSSTGSMMVRAVAVHHCSGLHMVSSAL
jgi:hypothetical protein